ncbi:MAG: hypothetical protein KDA54_05555 [Phycisphaerales bacterium]|nr:hypothetical protein [Phycisphaerales bacterium]
MNRIIELILKTFSLLEAEGRAAKHCAVEFMVVALLCLAATGLAFAGVFAISASLYFALTWVMPAPLAGGIVGIILCGVATKVWTLGEQTLKEQPGEQANDRA